MNIRKATSLTAALSFVLMVLTSIVLYIVPHGRVAYWANWKLWGLSKTDWGDIHINLGLLFLIALFLHIYYNWKPLIAYLKNKAKQLTVFTPEFNAALLITIACVVCTYFSVPPFSWVITLNGQIKDSGTAKYGEPPYGHAELSSLQIFAKKMNLDLDKSMQMLEAAGYPAANADMTLQAIADQYNRSPQQIYEIFKTAAMVLPSTGEGSSLLPEDPQPGTGNLTLDQFCTRHGLDMAKVIQGLAGKGIEASGELTLKEIASRSQSSPTDIYERIKAIVQK
ncbi:hypothetical protein DSCW_27560 [Desulfosarcina widdelii]|uniref:Flavinylation-associated cytochrome domain-containing protein n=1 Tax=Desulfosarcina widdelii TaxID=947919 RepID=A0A5K7Z545_9BACT|nr:DUF4405 domain-containing protein [Desulfosarcina widdelii]BBO75339.1 hypothetical protein DSCW_27560 [Desulfosarcina widdelii]